LADAPKLAKITVDGRVIEATPGVPLLQAMLDAEIDVPHYCYHPKLTIDGSCRFCQVKIEGIPKLQISCNTQVRDGMVVHTQDPDVEVARRGVMELLLLNHPLDCPICDKAGECWLQNYSMRFGTKHARTLEPRRKRQKRVDIGARMLLDQERCILCRRCVRFCREVSKTHELGTFGIGDHTVLDLYPGRRLDNDYSMNTADICPVGALETKDFHHKIRVWFLEETGSICPGCANGCNLSVSAYKNRIWRLIPRRNDAVNDAWMCDEGRLSYKAVAAPDRARTPMVARNGRLVAAEWPEAVAAAAAAIADFKQTHGGVALGAVVSPHLTNEENFRFGQLLNALGVKQTALAVRHGKQDDFLIRAEKAANARGVRELGLAQGKDDGLEALLRECEAGAVRGLYVCGNDLLDVVERERLSKIFASLELLIIQASRLDDLVTHAQAFIPATMFAEKDGSFTNHAGRVQRIQRALKLPDEWLNDGAVFTAILNHLESRHEEFALPQIWSAMERDGTPFSRIRFDELGAYGTPLDKADKTGDTPTVILPPG
jgi:NADH-quinone oxidoreductase subunit G